MKAALRIFWHEVTCPAARVTAMVRVSDLGRIYSCGCGFEIFDVWRTRPARMSRRSGSTA